MAQLNIYLNFSFILLKQQQKNLRNKKKITLFVRFEHANFSKFNFFHIVNKLFFVDLFNDEIFSFINTLRARSLEIRISQIFN